MSLVEVRSVSKQFRSGGALSWNRATVLAVDRVSFHIEMGESLCVAGESGSGKTTVARMLVRLETASDGSILFDGKDIAGLGLAGLREFRRRVQMVSQNPYDSLNPRMTVARILGEPLRVHGLGTSAAERREMIEEVLDLIELRPTRDFLERYPHELSGGQRQRVSIGRTIMLDPNFVVLDEPVSMLDVSVKAGIINLLRRIKDATNQAQFIVTHDLAVARYVADRTMVMYRGRQVEAGPTRELLSSPYHPYTRALVAAVPSTVPRASRRDGVVHKSDWSACSPSSCAAAPACRAALAAGAPVSQGLLQVGEGHFVACCALRSEETDAAEVPNRRIRESSKLEHQLPGP